jgi:hypothetical protein
MLSKAVLYKLEKRDSILAMESYFSLYRHFLIHSRAHTVLYRVDVMCISSACKGPEGNCDDLP